MLQAAAVPLLAVAELIGVLTEHFIDSEQTCIGTSAFGRLRSLCQDEISDSEWAAEKNPMRCEHFRLLLRQLEMQAKQSPREQLSSTLLDGFCRCCSVSFQEFVDTTLPN